jgi:hypothetical protein
MVHFILSLLISFFGSHVSGVGTTSGTVSPVHGHARVMDVQVGPNG